jgi:proteasome activator subunit 4
MVSQQQDSASPCSISCIVPSTDEITFVLDILDQVATPALDKVESLLETTAKWDNIARNDFCRCGHVIPSLGSWQSYDYITSYLHACRSVWSGLPTFYQEQPKEVVNPCLNEDVELAELLVSHLQVKAGFTLTDPEDPRYQKVAEHRTRFGIVSQRAASALRQNTEGEDHIDAVIGITKAIDVFLLDYGLSRSNFDALQSNYAQARE